MNRPYAWIAVILSQAKNLVRMPPEIAASPMAPRNDIFVWDYPGKPDDDIRKL